MEVSEFVSLDHHGTSGEVPNSMFALTRHGIPCNSPLKLPKRKKRRSQKIPLSLEYRFVGMFGPTLTQKDLPSWFTVVYNYVNP